ncbi:ATPase [Mactra antiquata]
MKTLILAICASLICVNAGKTPALIWSPSRPLSDLPQSYAGSTVSSDSFHENYLVPLSTGNGRSLVIFQQDKLSVEDFTNHADVYNPNSDGGAFKNVKSAMDGEFSVHLPAVIEPSSAINTLSSSFNGEVIRAVSPDDIINKNMENNKSYLIIVTLQPIDANNEYDCFKKNDEDIGKILHSLNKRDIKYSALYTGESPSKIINEDITSGRKLLADVGDEDKNGTFVAKSGMLIFLKYVSVVITDTDTDEDNTLSDEFIFTDANQVTISDVTNTTMNVNIDLTGKNGTAVIEFILASNNQYEVVSVNETFSYTEKNGDRFKVDKMPMQFHIQATRGFCFHCTKLSPQMWLKGYNDTDLSVSLKLHGFQIEAFNPLSNSTTRFSNNVWDCVPFFTTPIWMGILTTIVLVLILFYAMTMLSNLTTMDRFDDPKGKTITVTVNE